MRPGELALPDGSVVGRHEGHQHFTIGQRKGVGVAFGRPIYVVDIDPESNRVTLGEKAALDHIGLIARNVNWLSGRIVMDGPPIACSAKIRYNHDPQPATVVARCEEMLVRFDRPQPAITPGQAVVVYDGDIVLGGGWIEKPIDD